MAEETTPCAVGTPWICPRLARVAIHGAWPMADTGGKRRLLGGLGTPWPSHGAEAVGSRWPLGR